MRVRIVCQRDQGGFRCTLLVSHQVSKEDCKKTGFFTRLAGAVMRVIAPLM